MIFILASQIKAFLIVAEKKQVSKILTSFYNTSLKGP